jgi:hypothetical protein
MKLTKYMTILNFDGRREASHLSESELIRLFRTLRGRSVRFRAPSGRGYVGKVVDMLPEGFLVIERDKDGRVYHVDPDDVTPTNADTGYKSL